jgi:predicted PurR-regulated permease PerM
MDNVESPAPPANRAPIFAGSTGLVAVIVVVAALYFAREILIPFALAILFSFLLAPLVNRLRAHHVGRVPSVLIVVVLALVILGLLGELVASQMGEVVHKLPEYQQNVQKKLQAVASGGSGIIGKATKSFERLRQEILPKSSQTNQPAATTQEDSKPVPIEVRNSEFSPVHLVQTILGSLFSFLVSALIVAILVIFMLMERENLRDRLIRMIGPSKLNTTTQLLDDASQRVSRYLLMQLIVNVCYGVAVGVGLYFIGIPNPVLWGILTALMRYVPYAGIWVAASMPFALAIAVDPNWTRPLLVVGLFLALELTVANFAEPYVYGNSTGISPLGVLLSAIFWAWLWGPVGLLLSVPLTVCLASIGRYLPNLKFLTVLIGDDPVLSPGARFYQRLLGMNDPEATDLAEEFLKEKSLQELYDTMLIPALVFAGNDRQHGLLDEDKHQYILQSIRELVENLEDHDKTSKPKDEGTKSETSISPSAQGASTPFTICLAAGDAADEIAAVMLAQLLEQKGINTRVVPAPDAPTKKLDLVVENPELVCIPAVPPAGLRPARQMYRRLGIEFPDVKIVAGLLGARDPGREYQSCFPKVLPENLVTSLKEAIERILQLHYPANSRAGTTAPASA